MLCEFRYIHIHIHLWKVGKPNYFNCTLIIRFYLCIYWQSDNLFIIKKNSSINLKNKHPLSEFHWLLLEKLTELSQLSGCGQKGRSLLILQRYYKSLLPQAPLVGVVALGQQRGQAVEDDDAGDGVLLVVVRVPPPPVGRAVPPKGFWEDVQVSVPSGVQGRLEDRVWQCDSRLQVCGPGAPQGLVPRESGSGEIHLLQTVHGDDCGRETREC